MPNSIIAHTRRRTRWLLWGGLATLLFSTAVIGAGNCLSALYPPQNMADSPVSSSAVTMEN